VAALREPGGLRPLYSAIFCRSGGAASVGAGVAASGCTMPSFPDKFMPFMDEPPGSKISTGVVGVYGRAVTALRSFTNATLNQEPKWRHPRPELTTGFHSRNY